MSKGQRFLCVERAETRVLKKKFLVQYYIYVSGSESYKSNGLVVRVAGLEQDIACSIPAGFFRNFQGQDIVGSIPVAFFLFYMYILKKKTMIIEISGRLFFGSVSS